MQQIDLEQNSKEWLQWRISGVGASESSVLLMDNHPWSTPYKLYCLKLGLIKPDPPNWAMKRGTQLEPQVRDWFIKNYFPVVPICAEMDGYEFIKASLDGYSEKEDAIVEIKVTGRDNHRLANEGGIPLIYRIQMQHQLLVSGASVCYYVSFLESEGDYAVVKETPDEKFQEDIYKACLEFWEKVRTKTPPELTEKDEIVGDLTFNTILDKYMALDAREKEYKRAKEELKPRLVEFYSHDKIRGVNGRVFKRKLPGRYDMKAVERVLSQHGIPLSDYRKEDSYSWVIQKIKGEE